MSTKEQLMEKYNRNQYKGRFGIYYTSISNKTIKHIGEIKNKNIKKPIKKGVSLNENSKTKKYNYDKMNLYQKIINEANEGELDKLYNKNEKEDEIIAPIKNFLKIKKCSILKYGIRQSMEDIQYSYCKTCDYNLTNPICFACINQCHKGHEIKLIFYKGKIKCSCGEKNHYKNKINNNIIEKEKITCLFNQWNQFAKIGFYYINKNKQPICILCHNYCEKNNTKDKIIKLENNKSIPNCSCKNINIHKSQRIICEKIIDLIENSNEFQIFLHPIKFINMFFKRRDNFKKIFDDLEIFLNNLDNPEKLDNFSKNDIINTNLYKNLLIFEKMAQKKLKNCLYAIHVMLKIVLCYLIK